MNINEYKLSREIQLGSFEPTHKQNSSKKKGIPESYIASLKLKLTNRRKT